MSHVSCGVNLAQSEPNSDISVSVVLLSFTTRCTEGEGGRGHRINQCRKRLPLAVGIPVVICQPVIEGAIGVKGYYILGFKIKWKKILGSCCCIDKVQINVYDYLQSFCSKPKSRLILLVFLYRPTMI